MEVAALEPAHFIMERKMMRTIKRRAGGRLPALRAIALILVACAAVLAQAPDTSYFPCVEQQRGMSQIEGPALVSPDGHWRAYVRAEAENRSAPGVDCFNTTWLLAKASGDAAFQSVYVKKPEPYLQGNGLKLIAWSHKGHVLAAELRRWQYGSDVGGLSPLLYDADKKRAWEPELDALFDKRFGKKCAFVIGRVIGFDSRDRVLFEAGDYFEEGDEEPVPETRCLGQRGLWALDIPAGALIEMPARP